MKWRTAYLATSPEVFRSQLSRVGLADAFGELARSGWIREAKVEATQGAHWVKVIDSILSHGVNTLDLRGAEVLLRELGSGPGKLS